MDPSRRKFVLPDEQAVRKVLEKSFFELITEPTLIEFSSFATKDWKTADPAFVEKFRYVVKGLNLELEYDKKKALWMLASLKDCKISDQNEEISFFDEFCGITLDDTVTPVTVSSVIEIVQDLRTDFNFIPSELGKEIYRSAVRKFHLLDRFDTDLRSKVMVEAEKIGSKNASFSVIREQSRSSVNELKIALKVRMIKTSN